MINSIVKTHNGVKYSHQSNLSQDDSDTLHYTVLSYSFLLPIIGEFTFKDLAHEIGKTYCLDNTTNKKVYDLLLSLPIN